jgi:hypothetical protein
MKKDKVLPIRINDDSMNRLIQLQQGYLEMKGIKLSKAEIILRLIDFAFYEENKTTDLLKKRFVNQFGDLMHFDQ